jgi:hypothetical protein
MSVPKPAVTKRTAVAMPVPEVKAAPKRICFAHLAGDHSGEPLLALPAAQAPAPAAVNTTPKTDPAAIDSQWDLAHRKAASFLPVARAGRDAVARRWDRLMQAAMGRR